MFGFPPGADFKLATYEQSLSYFRKVAGASKYVKLVEAGPTSQGRTMVFALVSSPGNLSKLDRYREIARRLAHPRGLTEADARQLARDGRAFVHIDGGLHSTEVAGAQHTPLLLYDLVRRADDPDVKLILDNVVLMLWPTINPDGQQMVSSWYMENVGTPYELAALPKLYQEYVGHDNNRDAYMLNMIESRVLEHTWRQWEPQIIYVHHQSGPFPTRIWLPPFSEPVGIDAPFIMSREVNMIGMAIAKGLEERGQVGATHMGTAFDAWYPGYVDYAPNFKNIAAFWTETALFQYATPHTYTLDDFPQNMRDLRPQSLYASPWPPGPWRLRDAVDYMETASLSVLEFAAKYKDSLLLNRYRAGVDQIALGAKKPPFAYVVPQQQRDPVAAVELLRRLAFGGVRVSQSTADIAVAGETWPSGTWVVPTDQEFAAMAREVLDVQHYPDLRQYPGGPPERPYDAAGWTLPLQMGVRVVPVMTPLDADTRAKMRLLGPDAGTENNADAIRRRREERRGALRQHARSGFRRRRRRVRDRSRLPDVSTAIGRRPRRRSVSEQRLPRAESTRGRRARPFSVSANDTASSDCRRPRRTSSSSRSRSSPSGAPARHADRPTRSFASRAWACINRGPEAWTKAGRVGCSNNTASRSRHPSRRLQAAAAGQDRRARHAGRCAGTGGGKHRRRSRWPWRHRAA